MNIKEIFFLVLLGLFLPSFVGAEEPVVVEDDLEWMYYNGENSNWFYLDDNSYKKASTIQYFDKLGRVVGNLSLKDMDKVFVKMNSDEEVIFIQLYDQNILSSDDASESEQKAIETDSEESKKVTEQPLYKENGVWKN